MLQSANQQGIQLIAQIENRKHLDLIQTLLGDERRYQQILLNFLSNAVKFTDPDGQIKVLIKVLSNQAVNQPAQHQKIKEEIKEELMKSSSMIDINNLMMERENCQYEYL